MKLSIKATATACSLLWGGGIFTLALANVIWPNYGGKFLRTVASVYPGYNARRTLGDAAIGGLYAMVDGAVGGALYAWLYNRFAPASPGAESPWNTRNRCKYAAGLPFSKGRHSSKTIRDRRRP